MIAMGGQLVRIDFQNKFFPCRFFYIINQFTSLEIQRFGVKIFLFVEKKECKDVKPCKMKCPKYEVTNIRKVEGKPTMQADIFVSGIELNFGTIQLIELGVKLLSKEVKDAKKTPTIIKTDINEDDFDIYINGTIDNLIMSATYRAYIIIGSELEMKNMDKKMTEIVFSKTESCMGEVLLSFFCDNHSKFILKLIL